MPRSDYENGFDILDSEKQKYLTRSHFDSTSQRFFRALSNENTENID
jgi:hypothetical protein